MTIYIYNSVEIVFGETLLHSLCVMLKQQMFGIVNKFKYSQIDLLNAVGFYWSGLRHSIAAFMMISDAE